MRLLTRIADVQRALDKEREAGRRVGFVPTMGFLHEGHASLMRRARAENDVVAVSIFVNPLQFGANEDLDAYPRDLDSDLSLCETEGVDIVFHPDVTEMYQEPNPFTVTVGEIGTKLCGRARPGHFDGVATVVAKLFNIAGTCRAYFGRKDAQQVVVIERLVRALNFPVTVVGCDIIREPDGLAMSSRNVYLTNEERRAALVLKRALDEATVAIREGERDARRIGSVMGSQISSEPLAKLDYAVVVDTETLDDLEQLAGPALLAVAAWVGKARLIDNMTVTPEDGASSEGSS
ncbi:MAG TPA: pantoate--beta-alanine ligase [Actinomycetota bacterium]|nr:pantoate--beta-alanine ligase [Actinomycetota bacterium]